MVLIMLMVNKRSVPDKSKYYMLFFFNTIFYTLKIKKQEAKFVFVFFKISEQKSLTINYQSVTNKNKLTRCIFYT